MGSRFTRFGDWHRIQKTERELKRFAQDGEDVVPLFLGREFNNIVLQVWKTQPFEWPALSDSWAEYKAYFNLDPRKWISEGHLLHRGLVARRVQKGIYFAGASMWKKHYSGLTMYELATILEDGNPSMKIPPRSLFSKAINKFRLRMPKYQQMIARKAVRGDRLSGLAD